MAETEAEKKKRILAEKAEAKKQAEADKAAAEDKKSDDGDDESVGKTADSEPVVADEEPDEPLLDKGPNDSELDTNEKLNRIWVEIANELQDGVAKDQVLGALTAVQLRYREVSLEHAARQA